MTTHGHALANSLGKKMIRQRLVKAQNFPNLSIVTGCFAVLLMITSTCAWAHELRPAYLELRQTKADTYEVLWKVPARENNLRLALYVEFPADCKNITEPRGTIINRSLAERWTIQRASGLDRGTIHITGLTGTMVDVLVRLERLDGSQQITRLTPASPSFVVEPSPSVWEVARAYTTIGVKHILSGIDHLLFVLALLIITGGGWKLVKAVTAFTLSHSLTLAAATLGWVRIPLPPVEALIALSIVFVAAEIIRQQRGSDSLTTRSPWMAAFAFGLMHGLGFSGGLSEAGLPAGHIPEALLFFSIGVELGHLLFIGAVLLSVYLLHRVRITIPRWAFFIPPYAIGSVAMFWSIERLFVF